MSAVLTLLVVLAVVAAVVWLVRRHNADSAAALADAQAESGAGWSASAARSWP